MSDIITKQFEFEAHALTVQVDENGLDWFNANEVATALGYTNPRDAVKNHVDPDDVAKRDAIDNMGRNQVVNFVNESGLYSLILRSQKPEAKRFKRWVTAEVLPSIRQKGGYISETATAEQIELLKADLATKQALIEDLKDDVRDLEMGKKHDHVRISTLAARCDALKDESTHLRQVNKYIPKELTLDIDEDSSHMAELRRTSERLQVYVHKLKMKNMTLANSIKGLTHDLHMNLAKAHMYGELVFIVDTLCAMFINHPEARRYRSRIDELQEHLGNLERNNI